MIMQDLLPIVTYKRCQWIDITAHVQEKIDKSGFENGICTIASLHTTAALTVNENADPDVQIDFFKKLEQLIPCHESFYKHIEGNSDSHIKASIIGLSVLLQFTNKKLVLGTWQSIYFCEFDGPRNRHVSVTIIGE